MKTAKDGRKVAEEPDILPLSLLEMAGETAENCSRDGGEGGKERPEHGTIRWPTGRRQWPARRRILLWLRVGGVQGHIIHKIKRSFD